MAEGGSLRTISTVPPSETWLSFVACGAFEAILLFLCYHEQGPELAKRGPSILGRWLRSKGDNSTDGAAPVKINPPSSVEQSWRLGVLHERFFKGSHSGDESTLREAGEVLGVGRALTESEFLSLASLSERAAKRSAKRFWSYCSVSSCLIVSGVIGAICVFGPAIYYFTAHIYAPLAKAIVVLVDLLRAIPMPLRCLFTLAISMALVCDGFRAADKPTGRRSALVGAVGAIISMAYSTVPFPWSIKYVSWFWWLPVRRGFALLGFSTAVLAPIAVKFEYSVAGFLAVWCTFLCGVSVASAWRMRPLWATNVFASLLVIALFVLAVMARIRPRTLQPFCSGVMVVGVFYLNLKLHAVSGVRSWYLPGAAFWPNLALKLGVYPCLLGSWLVGKSIGCKGLTNNPRFFGFLIAFSTIVDLPAHLPGGGGDSLALTVCSLGLWLAGLHLRRHRDFFPSLWTLDAELLGRGNKLDSSDDAEGDGHPEVGQSPAFEHEQP